MKRSTESARSVFRSDRRPFDTNGSTVARLIKEMGDVDEALATLHMPDDEHCAVTADNVCWLVERRSALFHELVSTPELLSQDLPVLLQSVIAKLKSCEMISGLNNGAVKDSYLALERVAESLRKLCPANGNPCNIKGVAQRAIKRDAWFYNGSDDPGAFIANQSKFDPTSQGFHYAAVSEGWCEFMGYQPEEAIGCPVDTFLTADGLRKYSAVFPEFVQKGWFRNELFEFATKRGVTRRATISCIGECDQHGTYISGYSISRPVASD